MFPLRKCFSLSYIFVYKQYFNSVLCCVVKIKLFNVFVICFVKYRSRVSINIDPSGI